MIEKSTTTEDFEKLDIRVGRGIDVHPNRRSGVPPRCEFAEGRVFFKLSNTYHHMFAVTRAGAIAPKRVDFSASDVQVTHVLYANAAALVDRKNDAKKICALIKYHLPSRKRWTRPALLGGLAATTVATGCWYLLTQPSIKIGIRQRVGYALLVVSTVSIKSQHKNKFHWSRH